MLRVPPEAADGMLHLALYALKLESGSAVAGCERQ
jgi:hypothetical protein